MLKIVMTGSVSDLPELHHIRNLDRRGKLAKQMREAIRRGEDLGLSDDESAFSDALALAAFRAD